MRRTLDPAKVAAKYCKVEFENDEVRVLRWLVGPSEKVPMKKSVFKWMYWIHGWLGLILGVFLTVLGITGSLHAFLPELEVAEAPKLMAVKPSQGWISPGKVLTEVARAYPDYRLFLLVLPIEQTMPYRVYVADSKGELFRVSVNEYT